jgi:hypothetical protein
VKNKKVVGTVLIAVAFRMLVGSPLAIAKHAVDTRRRNREADQNFDPSYKLNAFLKTSPYAPSEAFQASLDRILAKSSAKSVASINSGLAEVYAEFMSPSTPIEKKWDKAEWDTDEGFAQIEEDHEEALRMDRKLWWNTQRDRYHARLRQESEKAWNDPHSDLYFDWTADHTKLEK